MSARKEPDLREAVALEVVIYDGRPAIKSTSTRRKNSTKVETADHVEHLTFVDPDAGIAFGQKLIETCEGIKTAAAAEVTEAEA